MKNLFAFVVAIGALALGPRTAAGSGAARFEDPAYGFSVEIPSLGEGAKTVSVQRLVVADQPAGGFAPNCNVQVQVAEMSLDGYLDLTRQQFAANGFELLESKAATVSARPASVLEYAGPVGGRSLRFLALVVAGADRFWLLTCTATADTFAAHRPAFAKAVESFALTKPGR
jgi:hypothetical protein